MTPLRELLEASAAMHHHLCPRQVLGVRMGLMAGEALQLDLPRADKRLLAIIETDGCAADGIGVVTHCSVGHRTMRVEDCGKVAATFVDTHTGQAVRIVPRSDVRQLAYAYAPTAGNKWQAQLLGYQSMPATDLLDVQTVHLVNPLAQILGRPGMKAICDTCGEEIMNGRETIQDGKALCKTCSGQAYYLLAADPALLGYHLSSRQLHENESLHQRM